MNTGLGRMFGFGGGQADGGHDGGQQQQQESSGGGSQDKTPFDNSGSPFYDGESNNSGNQDSNPGAILASIFGAENEDGGDGGGSGNGGGQGQNQNLNSNSNQQQNNQQPSGGGNQNQNQPPNEHDVLAQELARGIQQLTLPQDAIPENFDPTDPAQLTQVMQRSMQQSAMTAIQLAFRPMQVAMQQLTKDVKAEIQASLNGFGDQQRNRTTLTTIVPEADDPQYSPMVNMLFEQAMKKKGTNANQAAQTVRKALDAMNIRGGNQNRNSGGDPMSGGFREGKSALDAFAPLPGNFGNQQQQRR